MVIWLERSVSQRGALSTPAPGPATGASGGPPPRAGAPVRAAAPRRAAAARVCRGRPRGRRGRAGGGRCGGGRGVAEGEQEVADAAADVVGELGVTGHVLVLVVRQQGAVFGQCGGGFA